MAQFRFKFQSVLEHRRTLEDHRQRDLAQHLRKRLILREQLQRMQQAVGQSKHDLASGLVGKVDLSRVQDHARYTGETTHRTRQLVQRLSEVEDELTQARQRLLEATRHRKAMELLRDRHHRTWREQQRRREDREMDEIAMQQHMRRSAREPVA